MEIFVFVLQHALQSLVLPKEGSMEYPENSTVS
jgi:hypothetical protein